MDMKYTKSIFTVAIVFLSCFLTACTTKKFTQPEEAHDEKTPVKTSFVIHVSKENFDREVVQSELPVVLDVYATWCPPCRALGPIIEKLAREYQGKYTFAKLNADENSELVKRYGVTGLPTLIFIKNNMVKGKSVGLATKEVISKKLAELFN